MSLFIKSDSVGYLYLVGYSRFNIHYEEVPGKKTI